MRIVAQSTLADGSPYLHLGYTSAMTTTEEHPSLTPGGIISIGGLLLAAASTQAKPLGRRRWWCAGVGLACVVLGIGLIVAAVTATQSRTAPAFPDEWTMEQQSELIGVARRSGRVVESLQDIPNWKDLARDGWQRIMRTERTSQGRLAIRSAGQDGQWNTQDDVVTEDQASDAPAAAEPESRPAAAR